MIFNLQMKQSERLSIALALSMGVVAGITGIMKAYYGYKLLDVRSTHCTHSNPSSPRSRDPAPCRQRY